MNFVGGYFWNFDNSKPFLGVMWGPTQNLGPIGSANLTFIGYNQTQHTDRQVKYIFIDVNLLKINITPKFLKFKLIYPKKQNFC